MRLPRHHHRGAPPPIYITRSGGLSPTGEWETIPGNNPFLHVTVQSVLKIDVEESETS